jgi:hypothetical protein
MTAVGAFNTLFIPPTGEETPPLFNGDQTLYPRIGLILHNGAATAHPVRARLFAKASSYQANNEERAKL